MRPNESYAKMLSGFATLFLSVSGLFIQISMKESATIRLLLVPLISHPRRFHRTTQNLFVASTDNTLAETSLFLTLRQKKTAAIIRAPLIRYLHYDI